jgi:hypothetical protein
MVHALRIQKDHGNHIIEEKSKKLNAVAPFHTLQTEVCVILENTNE